MKKRHNEALQRQIKSVIKNGGKTMVRRAGQFSMSERQKALIRRIIYVRDIVKKIPDNEKILIDILGPETDYLFRFTNISEKNVIGLAGEIDGDVEYIDSWNGYKRYKVYPVEDAWKAADCIIVPSEKNAAEGCIKKLNTLGYTGRIVSLLKEDDGNQFFSIWDDWTDLTGKNKAYSAMVRDARYMLSKDDLLLLGRIDKINRKLSVCGDEETVIYCAGKHTNHLLDFTNAKYLNLIAIVDKNAKSFHGIDVKTVEKASFQGAKHIIVSSYRYQKDIYEYLCSLGLKDKTILLYDDEDTREFYFIENECAPDLCYGNLNEMKLFDSDVRAHAEREMNLLTRNSDFYLTYCMYPDPGWNYGFFYRGEEEVRSLKGYENANAETAIIIQGPIVYDDDFTLHTIQLYQINYPGISLILSTWKNEESNPNFSKFKEIKDLDIVLSDPPMNGGILNVNYQRYSTYAGIKRASNRGIPYVMKTRTDFRLYEEGAISHVWNLTKKFPISGEERQRLSILNPVLDVPYYIPDFVLFGSTKDMLNFWNIDELYPEIISSEENAINPEGLLFGRYFKRIGCYVDDPVNNLEDYAQMLGKECIVVDPATYKYIWKKYSYEGSITFVEGKNMFTSIDWLKWLNM